MTLRFFYTRALAGLVYINHSSEKSTRLTSLLNSLGNDASLFSWRWSFFSELSKPILSGSFYIRLSLMIRHSSAGSHSKFGGSSVRRLFFATNIFSFCSFQRSRGSDSIWFPSIFRVYMVAISAISSGSILILFSLRSTFTRFLLNKFRLTYFRFIYGISRSFNYVFWSRWWRRLILLLTPSLESS